MRIHYLFISAFLFVYSIASGQTGDTLVNSILFGGNVKGFNKTWKSPDGSYTNWYQYNDRGRGDSLVSSYRQDDEGFPTIISVTGKDYFKNIVSENFSWTNGIAKWKNNAEDDEKKSDGKLFYSPLKGTGGNIVKALRLHHNQVQLLPFGEINLKELQKMTVGDGASSQTISLCSFSGFSLTPVYTWVDEDGETFANVSEWFNEIRKGYEKYTDTLFSIQQKITDDFYTKLAKEIPEKLSGTVLIKNVNLFDSEKGKIIANSNVVIKNGIITGISRDKSPGTDAVKIIDGTGKTLLPGLWDMHVHYADEQDGILHMAAGVIHVRDMGNGPGLIQRIERIGKGELIGPNVEIRSGFIDGAGPLAAPTGALINSLDEGKKAIAGYAAKGYQQIKLYSSIKPEWVKPLIDEARKYKMHVCGHIPAFMTASQAIAAGYDEVTHMNMLVLNFFGDTVDTRSPLRFSLPAQKAATLDINGKAMKDFIRLLKEKDIVVDPTLGVFEGLFTFRDGKMLQSFDSIVNRFPVSFQRNIRAGGGGLPVPDGMNDTYLQSFEVFLKIAKLLYDNNIRIVPGTDGFAGFDLHRELELYVKAGIPAAKVLQIATSGAASVAGKSNEWGTIKPGRKADVILVDGNPVENISDIRKTIFAIRNNQLYDAAKLYNAVSIKPYTIP